MTISRATLPQEFFDITSDMLLVAPEPQYLHGQLIKMALGASLNPGDMSGISPDRGVGSKGADYGTVEQDRLFMSDPIYGEAVKLVPELGKGPGHTIRINRPVFANTTYTQASRLVATGATISTTPVDVTSEQVNITLSRFAGPYSASASAVAPLGIDKFDARLPVHSLVKVQGKHLKRDFDRFIDAVGVVLFDLPTTIVRPAGFAASADSTIAGDAPLDYETLTRVEKTLDEANVPMFPNGKRVFVGHPRQIQQLKNDPTYLKQAVFDKSVNPLMTSYVSTVGNLDIFVSNTLSTESSTVTIYRGQAFGPGMVGIGAGNLPHVAYSTADNYGEQSLVIWLWYAGFQNLDVRFGVGVKTS